MGATGVGAVWPALAVGVGVGVDAWLAVGLGVVIAVASDAPGLAAGVAADPAQFQVKTASTTTAVTATAPTHTNHALDIGSSVRGPPDPTRNGAATAMMWAMTTSPILSVAQRRFLATVRRVTLVTLAADGRPRPVPICFVFAAEAAVVYTPIDDKPKRTEDPLSLARVRDIAADPRVAVLADRWDEDWTRLAWLRADGRATLLPPGPVEHAFAVEALREVYPQYRTHRLEGRPLIRIEIVRVTSWGALELL
jgi:PPOX class probable F420-dependent enzyme